MTFDTLLTRYKKGQAYKPEKLLALDPGGTIGFSVFTCGDLTRSDQVPGYDSKTNVIDWLSINELMNDIQPTIVVCEDYLVYAHKLEQHTFSVIPTLRIIGAIEYWCWLNQVPIYYQKAMQAKGFCTDAKLKEWGLWQRGQRHSRDSIRHACYWLLFQKEYDKDGRLHKGNTNV